MSETHSAGATPSASKNPSPGDPNQYGRRTGAAGQSDQAARAAEIAADKAGEATQEAVRANGEILRTQVETAQNAMHASMEAGMRAFEDLSQNVSRAFGTTMQNPEGAEQSARNVRAVSQASTALAKGGQEASRAWLELAQHTMRTNLEAISEMASCRSLPDLVAVQTNLARDNLQRVLEGGKTIARASTQAIEEASQAMQSANQGARPPA